MSQAQLDDLFTQSPSAKFPAAKPKARDHRTGKTYTQDMANFVRHFAWQENFDPAKGILRTKILPFGLNAIIAKVYKGPSWLDSEGGASFLIIQRLIGGALGA